MAAAIMQHEQGPEIQYYLGTHPEEAARISAFTVPYVDNGKVIQAPDAARQLMELGLIAASLRAPAKPAEAAAPPAKPLTQAPAPLKPAAAGAASVTKSIDEMSMEEYAAHRKAQLAKEARPGARR